MEKSIYRHKNVNHRKFSIKQPLESSNSFGEGTICFIFLQIFLLPHFFEVELTELKHAIYKCKSSGIQK